MEHDPWRLNPDLFPKRLEVELSADALASLDALSARTGRSVRDLVEDLLSRAVTR